MPASAAQDDDADSSAGFAANGADCREPRKLKRGDSPAIGSTCTG
jgi:hypothetical protein